MHGLNRSAQARAALLWGVASLIAAQFLLAFPLPGWVWTAHDTEYALRLTHLHRHIAESPPDRPLVLLLGNSRVGTGIHPELLPPMMAANKDGQPSQALVYNFALCGSGPLMELLCLRRLLDDGVRPDYLLVEMWQPTSMQAPEVEITRLQTGRLRWSDLDVVSRYHPDPDRLHREWWELNAVPVVGHRERLLTHLANFVLPPSAVRSLEWAGLNDWGWLCINHFARGPEAPTWRQSIDAVHRGYSGIYAQTWVPPNNDRALRELLDLCRQEGIAVGLLLMPDELQPLYTPAAAAFYDRYINGLRAEYGLPVVDMRTWLPSEAFVEGVHLTHATATAFSERFGREALAPLLAQWRHR